MTEPRIDVSSLEVARTITDSTGNRIVQTGVAYPIPRGNTRPPQDGGLAEQELAAKIETSLGGALGQVLEAVETMLANPSPESLLQGERALHATLTGTADKITRNVLEDALADQVFEDAAVANFRVRGYQVHSRRKPTSVQLLGGLRVPVSTVYMVKPRKKGAANASEADGVEEARASIRS